MLQHGQGNFGFALGLTFGFTLADRIVHDGDMVAAGFFSFFIGAALNLVFDKDDFGVEGLL